MKLLSRFAPVLAALLIAGCAQTPAKPDESAYAPPGAGFSAQMPAPVREKEKDGTHMYYSGADGIAYIVGYSELSPEVASVKPDRLYDVARDRLIQSGKASVIKEEKTTLDGQTTRDLYLKTTGGYFMHLKMAVSGARFYRVSTVAAMKDSQSPAIAKFMDSFHFTKQ